MSSALATHTLGDVGLSEQLPPDWCCGGSTDCFQQQTNKQKQPKTPQKTTEHCKGVRETSLEFQLRLELEKKKKVLFIFVGNIQNFYVKKEVAYLRLIVDESAHSKRYILK